MSLYDRDQLAGLSQALGYSEIPMAMFYTDTQPDSGFSPKPCALPTKEAEDRGQIDWQEINRNFSCVIGHIWRARKKHSQAWFSAERFGCAGAAFYLGYLKPQTDAICAYVSSGFPGVMEGEHYVADSQACRRLFEEMDPLPAGGRYCVFKPLDTLAQGEKPELVMFFARPEIMSGLHFLSTYLTNDLHAVATPFGAGCTYLVTFARQFAARGERKAVLGGWDPSCRKYYKTDELSFSVTWPLFEDMLARWQDSFLTRQAWRICRKKIALSNKTWGEAE